MSFRIGVGGDRLPIAQSFGCVEVRAGKRFEVGSYSFTEDGQLWVMPLMSGSGRYSVGLSTVPVEDFCPW